MRWSKTVILFYCDTLLWKNPAQSKSNAVYKGRSTFTGRSHGVPTLISSIIWTRKNNISFKSYYIQALTRRKNTQKVYKWIFQIVVTKNASITCMFIQNNSFYSLIHSSLSSILIVHKNTHSSICLKFLCDAELIMPLLFLNISSKSLKWKQHFYTDTSWNYLFLNMAVWWGYISRRKKRRDRDGGTDEQPLSDKPPLIRCGENYSIWQ